MVPAGRILLVGNFLSASLGIRFVCEDLAERLVALQWSVIKTSDKARRFRRLCDILSTVYRQRHCYDVSLIEVYSGLSFFWAEAAAWAIKSLGKPYVLSLHGGNLPPFARRWRGRVQRLLKGAQAITTPSLYLQSSMASLHDDIKYLPNGLDLPRYPFRLRTNPEPWLCWLRGVHRIYNPALAVDTLARLSSDFPGIRLNLIGPDKGDGALAEVQELARKLGVHRHLQIIGAVPKYQVPRELQESDIFLNTTNYESFGVSVMEAAAAGLCIVSTRVGEIPYLWQEEQNALLVPPNDPQAMAAAVRRLLTEPDLAARLSGNARQKAEQYDWSVIMPQWESLLGAVIEGWRC